VDALVDADVRLDAADEHGSRPELAELRGDGAAAEGAERRLLRHRLGAESLAELAHRAAEALRILLGGDDRQVQEPEGAREPQAAGEHRLEVRHDGAEALLHVDDEEGAPARVEEVLVAIHGFW
jgi:hypothetical protein